MLTIRFLRTGKKNQPFFRIVVTDKKNPPRGGRFLEILGFFNPLTKEKKLKVERMKYWLSVGAQPSDRVHNLLVGEGILKGKKVDVHKKSKKKPASAAEGAMVSKEEKKETAEAPKTEPLKEKLKEKELKGGQKIEEEKSKENQKEKPEKGDSGEQPEKKTEQGEKKEKEKPKESIQEKPEKEKKEQSK